MCKAIGVERMCHHAQLKTQTILQNPRNRVDVSLSLSVPSQTATTPVTINL
jgi:hypothetical protein